MTRRDDDELALPDDLRAVEALLVAVRDVARTPDMAARARAEGEAGAGDRAIGTPVEAPGPGGAKAKDAPAARPAARRGSARLAGPGAEPGRLRSKVALLQVVGGLAGGVLGVGLLVGSYRWASSAPPPPPPPTTVVDDPATLRTAQERAEEGQRKAAAARFARDRPEAARLFREALADLEAALVLYHGLLERYPGPQYEYLGPETDRLHRTKMQLRTELMAASAGVPLGTVAATLVNLPDRAEVRFEGTLTELIPEGARLSVSLRPRHAPPDVEGAVVQVEVPHGGSFAGVREWPGRTLAPMGYRTEVTLVMRGQREAIWKRLADGLGYSKNTAVTIATDDDDVGTPEDQARFAAERRRALRDQVERASELHARLEPRLEGPQDTTWATERLTHEAALSAALAELRAASARHAVLADAYAQRLEADLDDLLRLVGRVGHGGLLLRSWTDIGDDLRRLRATLADAPGDPDALLAGGLEALARGEWERANELFQRLVAAANHLPSHEERLRAAVVEAAQARRLVEQAERVFQDGRDERTLDLYQCMKLLRAWLPADHPSRARCERLHRDLLADLQREQRLLRQR